MWAKARLNWTGVDADIKSSPDMCKYVIVLYGCSKSCYSIPIILIVFLNNRLLKSKQTFQIKCGDKEKAVTYKDGTIMFGQQGGICNFTNCWQNSQVDKMCYKHCDGSRTHFLVKDNNPNPTYAFLSTRSHTSKADYTFDKTKSAVEAVTVWRS